MKEYISFFNDSTLVADKCEYIFVFCVRDMSYDFPFQQYHLIIDWKINHNRLKFKMYISEVIIVFFCPINLRLFVKDWSEVCS